MATPPPAATACRLPTLIERVRALPQELIDQIEGEVFICVGKTRTVIQTGPLYHPYTNKVRAPDTLSLLRVSKATRAKFIRSWYADATISLDIEYYILVEHWMGAVGSEHRALIREALFVAPEFLSRYRKNQRLVQEKFLLEYGVKVRFMDREADRKTRA